MKSLKIQNLILIEKAEIQFGPGLNILTGETGSGKSAILSAIRLIAGERADNSCIRKGADFALVEALLENGTFIRREIYRSGKNRCFIDDAQVTLSALKETINIEMVDQSATLEERPLLDTFANLLDDVKAFEASHAEEKALAHLLQIPKDQQLAWVEKDLALLEETPWKEEAALTEEHNRLTHSQELAEKMAAAASALAESASLKRIHTLLDQCARFDSKLTPLSQSLKSALLELDEVTRSVQSYSDNLEADPNRLSLVEKQISAIETLKRRFGPDLESQKQKLLADLDRLTHLDTQIASLHTLSQKNAQLAQAITQKRQKAAPLLASQALTELKSLNIPHAQFQIHVGDTFNDIRFLFSANPGLPPLPLEQCASGGEKSRLLLALKTILADGTSCLVFDEIDSNVGGHTAAILGEKLKRLAEKRQVICVTHFVQVAKQATFHFLVSKATQGDTAYTHITKLSEKEKEIEYSRMLGQKL